jgi:hypothetical protein
MGALDGAPANDKKNHYQSVLSVDQTLQGLVVGDCFHFVIEKF